MKTLSLFLLLFNSYAYVDQGIKVINSETGLMEYEYNPKNDNYSIDLAFSINANLMESTNLQGFRGQVTWFSTDYSYLGFANKSSSYLSTVSNLKGNYDASTQAIDILELGMGLSRRSNLITHFWNNPNVYDESMFSINYVSATTDLSDSAFTGPGLVASYAIFYRTSKDFHWSGRADYHLSSLTSKDFSSTQAEVDMTISWVALNIGLGFYF